MSPRSYKSSRASSPSFSDDEDAITPILTPSPERAPTTSSAAGPTPGPDSMIMGTWCQYRNYRENYYRHRRPVSRASSNADVPHLDLADPLDAGCSTAPAPAPAPVMTATRALDTVSLWSRMLAVQRVFYCYNSARISAALEDEELQTRVPSRTCLDLLNDSISQMPRDAREQVQYFIEHGKFKPEHR